MSTGLKHSAQDDQVNGELSPTKVPKVDNNSVDQLSPDERLSRVRDFFSKSGKAVPPIIKPKPKPFKKPSVVVTGEDGVDGSSTPEWSPGSHEDPGPIMLSPQSLAQFGQIADFDFDAVVRRQMLDNTPQKDRAALSQSKGLQSRRLPGHLVSKVPDDYASRRRALTYSVGDVSTNPRMLARGFEETDSLRGEEEMTEEERRKKILERAGITQSNPLAALGNILKRGSGGLRLSGRGRSSPKLSKKSPTDSPPPKPKVKPKKQKTPTSSPSLGRSTSEPTASPPKSPKAFRFLRRSSSKRKGNGSLEPEDRSETSSVNSLNIHSVLREDEEAMETEPSPQPPPLVKRSPVRENGAMDTSQNTTARSSSPLTVSSTSSSNKRDSAYFKTPQVESLFGSDSALFDSGELEALLGKGKSRFGKEKTPERALEPMEEEAKGRKKEESKKEVKPTGSSVRARLQLYDKGETSKPLSESTPKVETTKPVKKTRLFESLGDEDLFGSQAKKESSPKPDEKPKTETVKKTHLFEDLESPKHDENPKTETARKARLFEDLGSPKHEEKPKAETAKKTHLFDDLESPKHDEKPKTETARKACLFEDLESPKHDEKPKTETAKKAHLFEDLGSPKHEEKPKSETSKKARLFEDLGSPKHDEKPKTETAKKARLFEDLGSPKHDEKPKSETSKKARLFEDLGSPKHDEEPKTEMAKKTRLFEDLGGDEDLFSSKTKRDEKPKTSTEKKKAHLFEDELFQDDLKPTEPKASPERDVFGSPELEGASSSPRRHGSTPPKDEPDFGFGVSTAGHEPSSPTHPLFGESLDTTPAKGAEKPKDNDKKNAKTPGILSYDHSPQFSARLISERKRSKKQLDEFAESLFGETEIRTVSTDRPSEATSKEEELDKIAEDLFGEVPSASVTEHKTDQAMEEEEEDLDKIAEDLFGKVPSAPAEDTTAEAMKDEEELDKIAEALFGEVPSAPVKEAGKSVAKLSPEPSEISEPTSDPLGAMTQKSEEKTRKEDLFGNDAMDVEVPSDRESKTSVSEDQKSEKSTTPKGTAMEVSSAPTPDAKLVTKEVVEKKTESEDMTSKFTSSRIEVKKEDSKRTSRYTDSKLKSDSRVSSARSRFDTGNAKSTSPSASRSRRTTAETVKSAAERKAKTPAKEEKKDGEGGKPSWMIELQKRREGKKKEHEEKQTVAPAAKAASKEAAIPEWQKRVMERKKKSAEEKSPLSSSRSDRLGKSSTSPKSSRVGLKSPNGATGTNSPVTGRKSPAVGRKSPSNGSLVAGRKSPRSTNKTTTTTESRTKSPIRSRYREELGKSKSAAERAKSPEEKPALPIKPVISVDTTATKVSRKASFTKIEISSRKVEKKSDSKEEEKKPSWSEDIKLSKSPDLSHGEPLPNSPLESTDSSKEPKLSDTGKDSTIEVSGKETEVKGKKSETDDDVFFSSSEKTESSVSTVDKEKEKHRSPSPLLSTTLISSALDKESAGSSGSQSRHDSVSSDGGNGKPYRSQSLSHSRSPTPTGPTGPVKLSRSSSSSVPEWKQRLLERKRAGTTASAVTTKRSHSRTSSKPKEPELPAWKKELLAKKAAKSTDAKTSAEERVTEKRSMTTVSRLESRSPGNTRRKKEVQTPAFMKEFQQKKQNLSRKD